MVGRPPGPSFTRRVRHTQCRPPEPGRITNIIRVLHSEKQALAVKAARLGMPRTKYLRVFAKSILENDERIISIIEEGKEEIMARRKMEGAEKRKIITIRVFPNESEKLNVKAAYFRLSKQQMFEVIIKAILRGDKRIKAIIEEDYEKEKERLKKRYEQKMEARLNETEIDNIYNIIETETSL